MRPLPLALLAAALLLAGCFDSTSEDPAADANATASDVGEGAGEAEVAPVDDGTAPMSTDVGHMPHMHDYWSEREVVTLFDDDIASESVDPFMVLGGTPEGRVGAQFWNLPDGSVVMEGTGQMDFTATWSDPLVTSIAISYRPTPNDAWSDALPLPQGETVTIDVTPVMTDMPHMSASRWEFLFYPAEPGAMMGPFHLKLDIRKMRDIEVFPGHPDLFFGLPEKVLHDLDHEHTEQSYAARTPQVVTEGGFQEKFVTPTELIPMQTVAMRMELDILETSASPGEVHEIRFFYRGADTSFIGHPTVLPLEGSLEEGRLVYQVPVLPEQTDSPYAEESQWLFFVEPATKFTGQEAEPTAGGATDVSIRYHLKLIAYDHELPEYSALEGDGDSEG